MSEIFPPREQIKLKPLVPHVADLAALAPDSPILQALVPHILELIETAASRPKFDAALRAFWLIP